MPADQPLRKAARLRRGFGRPSATAISLSMVRMRPQEVGGRAVLDELAVVAHPQRPDAYAF